MSLEDLYREVILDHYRNPRNHDPIDAPDATAEGVNPLCGDEISLRLRFDGDTIADVSVTGQGCSISQSSASMMSEAIKGHTRGEIEEVTRRFRSMMDLESTSDDGLDPAHPGSVLGDLESLQGVKAYPVRIKCANLPWTTLAEALGDG